MSGYNRTQDGADAGSGGPMGRSRVVAIVATVAALAALLGTVGGAALANHQFPDVPTGNAFHDDIDDFANAGCATGFPDGTFHPQEDVKRQQMARFVNACGGRIDFEQGTAFSVGPSVPILTLELQPGALTGGGFILLTAAVRISTSSTTGFPCEVQFDFPGLLRDEVWLDLRQDTTQVFEDATGAMHTRFQVGASPTALSIPLNVVVTRGCPPTIRADAQATATYWPFDAVGDGGGESTSPIEPPGAERDR